jgi:hypothetical protein
VDEPGVAIIAELPTHCADPLERLRGCHEAMDDAKRQLDVLPADDIAEQATGGHRRWRRRRRCA